MASSELVPASGPAPEERAAEALAARETKEAAERAANAEESNVLMKVWRPPGARAAPRSAGHSMRRGCIQAMLNAENPAEVVAVHSRHSPHPTAFDASHKKKLSWRENPTAALGLAA
ncbi:hypothetical protein [Streptomyces sp. NPDC059631]|uniref:hypothetical protein n=1 Tax=unclassified Streptomyces TaxID=2593676 RepID=UPI0036B751D3